MSRIQPRDGRMRDGMRTQEQATHPAAALGGPRSRMSRWCDGFSFISAFPDASVYANG